MTLAEKLEPYGIDPDTSEGLRERLAAGFRYPHAPQHEPPKKIEPVRVAGLDGQWIEL